MTLIGHDPAIWAVVASQFLDKVPLQLWEARKARLVLLKTALTFIHGRVSGHGAFLHSVFRIMREMPLLS